MTVEELFGTLQQSVVGSWRKHLRTAKYGKHEALDEFYKEMPEKVDALIEAWMGANGKKIGDFENLLKSANYNTLSYLKELKKICKQGYSILGDNDELKSLLDDIVNLINSTLYKVKELSESSVIDLKDYLNEALVNEALAIPRKFNEKFTYDDLGLEDEEADFMKKWLKADEIYQLPELDENERNIKQFSKMYDLLSRSKELEILNFDYSTYIAYELPKGTVVVFMEDHGYCGGCFYLSSNKIDE